MPSQFSMNDHTRASYSADGPTGSPMETQLLPDAWYMMNAVRSGLNIRFLSPSSARLAEASWAFSIRAAARSRSVELGAEMGGLEGRRSRQSAYAAAIIAATSSALRLRGAGESNANSHH